MVDLAKATKDGLLVHRNIDVKDIMALLERNDILNSTEGRYAVVQDGPQRNSLDASWHQDGLTYEHPPTTVLLYCESEGRGDITTDLADTSLALKQLEKSSRDTLKQLSRFYVSRSGLDVHSGDILRKDMRTGQEYLSLCSRGWVRGDLNMTLEQMTKAMSSLFENLKPAYIHSWRKGDCLIFNNYKYLHRRYNPDNLTDPTRRLLRMWFI